MLPFFGYARVRVSHHYVLTRQATGGKDNDPKALAGEISGSTAD
jgi:hypothetical protein